MKLDLADTLVRSDGPVSIAVDASGIKVHNGGDWIRKVWKVKKGYLKIHFAVDTKTGQIVSMGVSSERKPDAKTDERDAVRIAREDSLRYLRRVYVPSDYVEEMRFPVLR
jgi:hypothetical protein